MAQNDKIQLFEDKRIRTAWDEEKEEWYFYYLWERSFCLCLGAEQNMKIQLTFRLEVMGGRCKRRERP